MLLICWRSWFTVLSVLVVVSLNNGPVTSKYPAIEWPRVLGVSPMRPNIKTPTDRRSRRQLTFPSPG